MTDLTKSKNRGVQSPVLPEKFAYRMFFFSLTLTIVVCFAAVFMGIGIRNTALLRETVLERGRSLFAEIVLTRRWAARYGGVYVRKGPGVESNPWLEHPDLEAADGGLLTLRNPALITREISEIAAEAGGFRFHITSLKPLNPGNAPDDFEARSLRAFERGKDEVWETLEGGGGKEFRYMGALRTEQSCLACHAKQGYAVGDIRGGISVSFSIDSVEGEIRRNAGIIVAAAVIISLGILGIVYGFVSRLRRNLDAARAELKRAALTDALTGLANRRHAMERLDIEIHKALRTGAPLSLAIMDADDFKKLNDQEGHLRGDAALKAIATAILRGARPYDITARYGGEEFLIVLPGAGGSAALSACERIREAVAKETAAANPGGRVVTVSVGIATLAAAAGADRMDPAGFAEDLLGRADKALYRAKDAGKNRCALG